MPEPEVVVVAREWLEFAEQDQRLARAGNGQRELFHPRQVCFEAQQAVEKAIKALCVLHEVDFPFTHDLVKLMQLLADVEAVYAPAADLEWLTQWGDLGAVPRRHGGQLGRRRACGRYRRRRRHGGACDAARPVTLACRGDVQPASAAANVSRSDQGAGTTS